MICPVCGEPFDHRASSHQGPECDRCSEEKMSGNISRLQDMTDDAISREAAVAALEHLYTLPISCAEVELAIDAIRALPAAGPAPQPTVPPEVKLALRVLLHHVEPGWDNCKTVVQLWLDSVPAPSDQCSGGMTCTHRAALKRCHELLQEAQAYVPENEEWHDQVTEVLLPCDEAMECPTVPSVPAPQPWESEEQLADALADTEYATIVYRERYKSWHLTPEHALRLARIALAGPGGKP